MWVHVCSPCIKTGSHCCMDYWSVFLLTPAGDGSGVGGGAERGGENEVDVRTNRQAEQSPGQPLDKATDSETV